MASIPLNGPQALGMNDFMSVSKAFGGLAKACRFLVHIKPAGFMVQYSNFARDLIYLCEAAELPGRSFVNVDVRYYGPNQKLPVQTQYEDVNLTFLCRNRSIEREFFDNWQFAINPINTFDFNYRDDYACEIDVYQYDYVGYVHTPSYKITLVDAYPLLVNSQPVTWQDEIFQRVIVNFTYSKWKRVGIDLEPRTNQPGGFSFGLVAGRDVSR